MTQLIAHLFGDYILQSDWMAQNKTKAHWPAFVHALLYSLCFVPLLTLNPITEFERYRIGNAVHGALGFRWLPWLVIFGSHFFIDRFRLARYVVWAKNLMGPWSRIETITEAVARMKADGQLHNPAKPGELIGIRPQRIQLAKSWRECSATGYPPNVPPWMSVWLLIVADNSIHLLINYCALRWL